MPEIRHDMAVAPVQGGGLLIQAIHGLQGFTPPIGVQFGCPAELCEPGETTFLLAPEEEGRMTEDGCKQGNTLFRPWMGGFSEPSETTFLLAPEEEGRMPEDGCKQIGVRSF